MLKVMDFRQELAPAREPDPPPFNAMFLAKIPNQQEPIPEWSDRSQLLSKVSSWSGASFPKISCRSDESNPSLVKVKLAY